ncbi:MAG: hypothetical protein FJ241_01110 [Nitrospira sp.]|nr:hypothetical protein [Nitrospira sp.]
MQDRLAFIKNNSSLHIFFIILIGFIIYSGSFHNSFIGDDALNIKISQTTVSPIGSRYISFLTFRLNYYLNGLNVEGYHLFNLFIHIANSILIYILLQLIFRTPLFLNSAHDGNNSKIISFLAALLFLSHPIQTTTVYFISIRFASVATFFYVLTIIMYLKARLNILESKNYVVYMLSAFIFTVLAMKSKEISFTIPVTIALTEMTFFHKKTTRRELAYLFLFSLTFFIIPLSRLDLFDYTGVFLGTANVKGQTLVISSPEYLMTQFRVIVGYLKSLFIPVNLHWAPYYRLSESFLEIRTITSFLLLLGIFSSAIYMLKNGLHNKKGEIILLSFGIFWFFITILIESSIIPVEDLSLDHRTYLPSVGFFIAISALLWLFMRKADRYIPLIFIPIFFVIALYSFSSYTKHPVFKNSLTLWGDSVSKDPVNPLANYSYGMLLYQKKRYAEAYPALLRAARSDDKLFWKRLPFYDEGYGHIMFLKAINECYSHIKENGKEGLNELPRSKLRGIYYLPSLDGRG